jgi:hypothetical protein
MIHDRLMDDSRTALKRGIAASHGEDVLDLAFAAWLTPEAVTSFHSEQVISEIVSTEKRSYRQTAALGILTRIKSLDEAASAMLMADLEHLFGREPIVAGTPMPFCMDGVALAGMMLGTHSLVDSDLVGKAANWFVRCAQVTLAGKGLEEWQECLLRLLGEHSSIRWNGHDTSPSIASLVSVSLRSKGIGPEQSVDSEQQAEEDTLSFIQSMPSLDLPHDYSVLCLAALNWIKRLRPVANLRSASTEDVIRVLRRFSDGLQHWTWEDKPRTKASHEGRKWHVDNEYHVQNILWLVLAPIFPDLLSEDYTPKVGPVQPRADIGLPSLRIIVEAKFMRSTDAPKSMIEQIAEDASLYLVSGSRYDRIVPFIWDDSRRTERHEEILRGLRLIRGITDAVIVSRPGSMV